MMGSDETNNICNKSCTVSLIEDLFVFLSLNIREAFICASCVSSDKFPISNTADVIRPLY
jgi:hypothetical protein